MKKLMVHTTLIMLLFSQMASAAIIKCEYQVEPCDSEGNHFFCNVYGWTEAQFCSATDKTVNFSRPGRREENGKCCTGSCWANGCCPPDYGCDQ